MRAVYLKNLDKNFSTYEIQGESFTHLSKVLRSRIDDDVLLIDGKGLVAHAVVKDIGRKSLAVVVDHYQVKRPIHKVSLAIGQVKKEALDLIIKQAVELGVTEIFIYESDFSQKYSLNLPRLQRLMISAMEQSNVSFLPQIKTIKLEDLYSMSFDYIHLFVCHLEAKKPKPDQITLDKNQLIIIGPEGGLAPREEALFITQERCILWHLPTGILRAPTAVAAAFGTVLTRLAVDY